MKRWIWITLGVLLLLPVGAAIAAYVLIDPEEVRAEALARASEALGREVKLGTLELGLLPPSLRAAEVRIGGTQTEPDPLLAARDIELRVALWPLLRGEVQVSALLLRNVAVQLPVGPDGMPRAPQIGPASSGSGATSRGVPASDEPASATPEPSSSSGTSLSLAVDRIELTDASLVAGRWAVENLDLTGSLDSDGAAEIALSAVLPGLGALEDVEAKVEGLLGGELRADASLRLAAIDLAELVKRGVIDVDAIQKLAGKVSGPVRAKLVGEKIEAASVELEIAGLALTSGDVSIVGDVPLRAALDGDLELDLTKADVSAPSVTKPKGGALVVQGKLGSDIGAGADILKSLVLVLGPNEIPVTPRLAKSELAIGACSVDLAPIAAWIDLGEDELTGGKIEIAATTVKLEPLAIDGKFDLVAVTLQRKNGPIQVSGPIVAAGKRIRGDGLEVVVGGETASIDAGYDLDAGTLALDLGMSEAKVDPLLAALSGQSNLSGILGTKVSMRGKPELAALSGSGELRIEPGKIQGFSLVETVLGELAPIAQTYAKSRGKDLARYEQEDFIELAATFALADGRLQLQPVTLTYADGRATLRGSLNLLDQTLDLTGEIELSSKLASDLIDTETDEPLVVPIERISGPFDSPKVDLSPAALTRTVTRLAAQVGLAKGIDDKLGDKLDEKLGKEGGEAVRGVLEGLLGGGKRKK